MTVVVSVEPEPDCIDFGVAEMKFRLAPEIAEGIERQLREGSFGYSGAPESLKREIKDWMRRRHGWEIDTEWLNQTYGLVLGVGCCIRALTQPGDAVLLHFPSYPPFYRAIEQNGRRLVRTDLVETERGWEMDFEDMERKIVSENVKLLILCSPQNPTGRVWTREELRRVGEMCLAHGVMVVSDEIHFDICYPGHEHSVFASLSDEFAANSVVLTAPSKTFNIAGMTISNVIIPSTQLRERVKETVSRDMGGYFNSFGYAACEAAYKSAEPWLDECLKVLEGNCPELKATKFIYDYFNLERRKDFYKKFQQTLDHYFPGLDRKAVHEAIDAAYDEYARHMQQLRDKGTEIIAQARREGRRIIVLAGRPYHVDPEVNHGIDQLIIRQGAAVISEDSVSWHEQKFQTSVLNQWTYHSRLYAAAKYCTENPDMDLVQLVSFGCGLDAVTTDETREILQAGSKLYTQLKIDEITNLGAVNIRLRSLFAALEERKEDKK